MSSATTNMRFGIRIGCDKEGCGQTEDLEQEMGDQRPLIPRGWQMILVNDKHRPVVNAWHYCPSHHLPTQHS